MRDDAGRRTVLEEKKMARMGLRERFWNRFTGKDVDMTPSGSTTTYGVVDFKTSQPRPHFIEFYGRQLHAYAYALEHPETGKFGLSPVTRLGLFVVEPVDMQSTQDGRLAYLGAVTWIEIPRDDKAFLAFLGEVLGVLDAAEPPPAGEGCAFCEYRQAAREHPEY